MQLIHALRYSQPSCLAFVGAGGKTTAIFKAARELLATVNGEQPIKTVLVTTSTHFGAWESVFADHLVHINTFSDIVKLEKDIPNGIVLLTGDEKNNLLSGLPLNLLGKVREIAEDHILPVLIEADGSHQHPLKAPAEHEPAIPDFIQYVAIVAGLQGLGKPLTRDSVHRPEKFAELSGIHIGEIITGNAFVKVLLNKEGGLKNIPPDAHKVVLLNQADTTELQSIAYEISKKLIPEFHAIVIASLAANKTGLAGNTAQSQELGNGIYAVIEPIGGIILAAGGSSRFGEPKQLLQWRGEPLIRHVANAALKSGLSPVIVVVGSSAAEVAFALIDLPVRIVNNSNWTTGLSSSIKTAITIMPKKVGGAVFLQADQPHIPTTLIRSLVEAHEATLNPIIAPQIEGQRGNPVLFDSSTFTNLLSLKGDVGGRALFGKFPVQWVDWHDSNVLLDIDSTEDYQIFLKIYPEGEEQE